MTRYLAFISLLLLLTFGFTQGKQGQGINPAYRSQYEYCDRLYRNAGALAERADYGEKLEALERKLNEQALTGFSQLIPSLEQSGEDSLAFHCWFKIGELRHYFDSLPAAQLAYRQAIRLKTRLPQLPDSFLFKPYLFNGSIHYSLNQFDSALANYKQAEAIAARYPNPLQGSNRLYNTLGALYYETGNFTQARNYFEKASAVLSPNDPAYKDLSANYKINLASALTKLELFDQANLIYRELLPGRIHQNEILHNIATVLMGQGKYAEAIQVFREVNYTDNKIIRLENDLAAAWLQLDNTDSAGYWINKALADNERVNGQRKNTPHGITLKYLGDQLTKQGELNKAIDTYQLAIMQFDHEFVDKDVSRNPGNFVTVFSYIQLFNTLVAKADAMTRLYDQKGGQRMLESALDAYKSAFDLADYVEKTYDSDEARLFLNKIKYTVHNKPIDVSLRLYALTRKRSFLEDAYQYDQQSKASILSLNVRENEIRNTLKVDNPLVIREASLKNAITRLSLKASQLTDSPALQAINASIRDYKIQLGKIQDAANADPVYRQKRLATGIPTVRDVQQLLDESTSLLSYHLADTALVILVINPGSFDYARLPIDRLFFTMVDSLKHALGTAPGQHRYGGSAPAMFLYNKLIHPIAASLSGKTRLIVIPDDELNYLPFEALQDSARHYLVENFSVQYQYSTALLDRQGSTSSAQGLVAFAPFARRGFTGSGDLSLPVLPASQEETRGLKGETLIDSQATRERFLQQANKYGIIHLATHASVDNESPLRSYIAFYPSNEKEEYRLYAGEIYNLSLDSTRLVVLSACETGTGQLVKGEGLMSLTRAFTYAGCPNIITSLWKAEDKTTAFITRRLHEYLEKGHTKDWALRQAKLDLLNDTEMDPRFKTPDCWAHLIFIGEYERGKDGYRWWMVAVLAVLIALVLSWLIKRKPSRRDRDGTGFHR